MFGVTTAGTMASVELDINFKCTNTLSAASLKGVNTLILSAGALLTPDLISIAAHRCK